MLQNYVMTGQPLDFLVAFLAGFTTFFAGCLLPLVPTYLAYLSGVSLAPANSEQTNRQRWRVIEHGLMFVLGFILVFVLMGAASVKFAAVVSPYRAWIQKIGGIIFIWMGLSMLGIIKSKTLNHEFKLDATKIPHNWQKFRSFLTGIVFAAGWTPCIGPVLAVVIYWAGHAETALLGSTLLFTFGVGLGTPFLLIAILFDKILPWLEKQKQLVKWLSLISGAMVLGAGALLFSGQFQLLSHHIMTIFGLRKFLL